MERLIDGIDEIGHEFQGIIKTITDEIKIIFQIEELSCKTI